MFKQRLTYANVAATLALVFSMSGGALAASHYIITSTKQISPKVVKALKGKTGKTGPTGPAGPQGKEGAPGKEGLTGKEGPAGIGPAFSAYHDGSVSITGTEADKATVVATLGNLPAGKYVINAKLYTFDSQTSEDITVCRLVAEGDSDEDVAHTSSSASAGYADSIGTFPLQVVHQFNGTGSASVECYVSAGEAKFIYANHTKITAIQVSALTNTNTEV
jgi:Collagen triple helix repeat (20 copies)